MNTAVMALFLGTALAQRRGKLTRNHGAKVLTMDMPVGGDGDLSVLDLMRSTTFAPAEEILSKATLAREIEALLSQLPPREQQILRLRFGFDNKPKTLEEIGQMLGLTRERVRQIEKQAKEHLRVKAKMKALVDYLD